MRMVIGAVQQVIRTIFIRDNSKNSAHKTSLLPIGILSIVQKIIDGKLPPAEVGVPFDPALRGTHGPELVEGLPGARSGEPKASKEIMSSLAGQLCRLGCCIVNLYPVRKPRCLQRG